jgi:hypothetical protein
MYKNGFAAMLRKNVISMIENNTSILAEAVPSDVYFNCEPTTVGIIPNVRTTFMMSTVVRKHF